MIPGVTNLSPLALALFIIVSIVLPLVSSLLVKNEWVTTHPEIGGILTLLLSAVTGVLTEALKAGNGFAWKPAVLAAVVAFVLAAIGRARLWVGSTADRKALNVGSKTKA
jgi:hypothetical protein